MREHLQSPLFMELALEQLAEDVTGTLIRTPAGHTPSDLGPNSVDIVVFM